MIFLKTRKSRKKNLSKKMVFLKIRKSRKKILRKKAERQNSVVSPTQSYKRMMQKVLHQTNLMLNREKNLFHLSNDVFREYNI